MARRQTGKSEHREAVDRSHARDFRSEGEIGQLLHGARQNRHGPRDHLLVLMMYRHGLRVSEAIGLCRSDPDLTTARLWVRRLKSGLSVEQPIAGDELRAIKRHLAARRPGLGDAHPHTLRHTCGYYLANRGHDLRLIQDYLGHREPRHAAHYTRVAAHRFEGLWDSR